MSVVRVGGVGGHWVVEGLWWAGVGGEFGFEFWGRAGEGGRGVCCVGGVGGVVLGERLVGFGGGVEVRGHLGRVSRVLEKEGRGTVWMRMTVRDTELIDS